MSFRDPSNLIQITLITRFRLNTFLFIDFAQITYLTYFDYRARNESKVFH